MKQITAFWYYFKKNEQEIINAYLLGINSDEVFTQINKKLNSISRRINFIIKIPTTSQEKYTIIFTCFGNLKLFPIINALEEQAPTLKYFTAQAFIKPMTEISEYRNGTDKPWIFENFEIKISEIQVALLDYNIASKQIKINLYLLHYNEIKQHNDLISDINWIVMQILGEIAFRKHIKEIKLHQLPLDDSGLLCLIDLPDFIDYLYKINSRKKTRQI